MRLCWLVSLIAAYPFFSCSLGTDPGDCLTACRPLGVFLTIQRLTEIYPDSVTRTDAAVARFLARQEDPFGNAIHEGVYAGTVRLNEQRLLTLGSAISSGIDYELQSPPNYVQISPPTEYNVWQVPGGVDAFGFIDSIASPRQLLTLLAPEPLDTLSIQSGFTVRWNKLDSLDKGELLLDIRNYTVDGNGNREGNLAALQSRVRLAEDSSEIFPYQLLFEGFRPGILVIRLEHRTSVRRHTLDYRPYTMEFVDAVVLHALLSP